MANGDDGQKSSWTSWFAPGDTRRAQNEAQQQSPSIEARRPTASPTADSQSSPYGEHDDMRMPASSPFIAFKHFIDDHLAAVAEFPINLHDLLQKARDDRLAVAVRKAAFYKHWTGSDAETNTKRRQSEGLSIEAAHDAAYMLLAASATKNRHVPPEKIEALYADEKARWDYQQEKGFLSIPWFKNDPYSPISLELDPLLSKYDTKWRHAFEDLLEATLEKPMTSEERFGQRDAYAHPVSTWRGPGLDWMLSLQCRGILPPQLPSWYRPGRSYETAELAKVVDCCVRRIDLHDLGWVQHYGLHHINVDLQHLVREVATPFPRDVEQAGSTELDVYEQLNELANAGRQGDASRKVEQVNQAQPGIAQNQSHTTGGGCSDELGRAVVEIARQETEHTTDEYLDKNNFDFEAFLAAGDRTEPSHIDKEKQMENDERTRETMRQLLELIDGHESDHSNLISQLFDVFADPRQTDQAELLFEEERSKRANPGLQDYQAHLEFLEERERKRILAAMAEQRSRARPEEDDDNDDDNGEEAEVPLQMPSHLPAAQAELQQRPRVLSTMTKTQTTRLPDGSVKTEVVLKRRFADGREETQTSTQTSFDGSTSAGAGAGGGGADEEDDEYAMVRQQQNKDGKSWFWS